MTNIKIAEERPSFELEEGGVYLIKRPSIGEDVYLVTDESSFKLVRLRDGMVIHTNLEDLRDHCIVLKKYNNVELS